MRRETSRMTTVENKNGAILSSIPEGALLIIGSYRSGHFRWGFWGEWLSVRRAVKD